jgi:hypothetical protein
MDCLLQLCCSGITIVGLHSILLDYFQLVGDVPLGVLAATVTIPSMLNGPVVNVTLVLVVVAAMLLNVSFVTFNAATVLFEQRLPMDRSLHLLDCLLQLWL